MLKKISVEIRPEEGGRKEKKVTVFFLPKAK